MMRSRSGPHLALPDVESRAVHRLLLGIACLTVAAAAFSQQEVGEDRPRFSTSVDTVSLAVTLTDDDGRLVTGLGLDNFSIYEDGVEQELRFFSVDELSLKLVILLDVSGSMRQKLPLAQEAAVRFVSSLKSEDEVQVVEFGDRVMTLVEFTTDFDVVNDAIQSTEVAGATSLYNAIYISLKDLESYRPKELDRRAVIVLSDGNDTSSVLGFEDVREQARKTNVTIYAISLRANQADLKKEKYRNAKFELDQLANESGGVSYAPESLDDLAGIYDLILTELKSQYSLGYVSTNTEHDGKWRRLQILTAEAGTSVRSREGYFAPRKSRLRRRRRP